MVSLAEETVDDPGRIETHEWIGLSNLSLLVANFARVHIFLSLFDGNPDKWLDFIEQDGTADERAYDRPFIESLKRTMESDPAHLERIRRLMVEFSTLFASRAA